MSFTFTEDTKRKEYNLFISHSWKYSNSYDVLCKKLDKRSYFEWNDFSVPEDDPIELDENDPDYEEKLELAIRKQMKPCSAVLILAGVYASYSKWINKEIKIAKELNKPIIAIEEWGSEKTSQVVKSNANRIVKWNTESIVEAIREEVRKVSR